MERLNHLVSASPPHFSSADLILQWEELWRSRPAPRKAVVAAS